MSISTQNRNKAYHAIVARLPDKRAKVYQAIKELGVCTAFNIAFFLHWPINEVSVRITELKDSYLVIEAGSKENKSSKKKNTLYKLPEGDELKPALVEDMARLSNQQDEILKDLKFDLSITSIKALEGKAEKIRRQITRIKDLLN